jgi:hypothetical protein
MFTYPLQFADSAHEHITGAVTLDDVPAPATQADTCFRAGRIDLDDGRGVELVLGHSRVHGPAPRAP